MLVEIQGNGVLGLVEDGAIVVLEIGQTLEIEEVMILNLVKENQEVQNGLEIDDQEVMILNLVKEDQETLEIENLDLQVLVQDLLETRIQNQVGLVVLCQIQDLANILSKEIVINHLLLLFLW